MPQPNREILVVTICNAVAYGNKKRFQKPCVFAQMHLFKVQERARKCI